MKYVKVDKTDDRGRKVGKFIRGKKCASDKYDVIGLEDIMLLLNVHDIYNRLHWCNRPACFDR